MADEKKPDTSNFVEHLRLVHLTLALTCLISIVAVFSQDESSPKRAFEQVGLLIKLRDKWDHGDWIRDKIEAPRRPPERDATVVINGRPPERWRFSPSIQFIRKDGTPVQRSNGKPISAKSETGSDFEDLDHVKFIWDALKDVAQVMVPTEVHDGWSFSNSTQPVEAHINGGNGLKLREPGDAASADQSHTREIDWTIKQNTHVLGDVAANFIKDRKDESFFLSSIRLPRLIRPGDALSFIFLADIFPAVAEKTDINLLAQFKEGTAAADLPAGSFDVAFPDLEASSKYLTEVPLEKLQLHFREESNRAAEKIDVSFLKFPADELAYVGTGLIFVLSFYACAVLRDFRLRVVPGDKAWDVAWIGISKEVGSIAIFWASMLLPLGTALLLFEKGLKIQPDVKMYVMGGTVLAFGLVETGVFLSWSALQETERKLPAPEPMVT